jgi:hypothetical protein
LKSGKAIGAQANFAATFNWLVAAVRNLRGGKGVKVSWPADDTPEIATDGEDGNNGGGGGGGDSTVKAVADIVDTHNDETGATNLDVSYTDGATKQITIPGGSKITFNGTGATYTTGDTFKFKSSPYSNVEVDCTNGNITIGVYYT